MVDRARQSVTMVYTVISVQTTMRGLYVNYDVLRYRNLAVNVYYLHVFVGKYILKVVPSVYLYMAIIYMYI